MNQNEKVTTPEASAAEAVKEVAKSEAAETSSIAEESTAISPEEINLANAAASTGNVTDDGQGAVFFTAEDVRAMSREQVRHNLSKILKSMESGNF